MRADLHCHSTASDGTCPPAEVMARARTAGLDVIALTDHDTIAGHAQARRALPRGLTLVPGIELSCRLRGHSVHLLAGLGAPVTWEQVTSIADGGVVGRPHIARAMVAAGVVESPDEAFGPQWLGAGGRANVTRYAPDPLRAITLIRAAGGVAVLAHPAAPARGCPSGRARAARISNR